MSKVRVRFAPSPTGFLHIGSLRTVLFNYFIAKSMGGSFILRLEDTDKKREVAGSLEKIIEIIKWVGLEFDEGPGLGGEFGPYIQSERLDIYNKYIPELLDSGQAYRCFCAPERLTKIKEEQAANKLPPRYDRACRNLSPAEIEKKLAAGEKFSIRQAIPLKGEIGVRDEIKGEIKFKLENLEDHILIKSNGDPTYHYASVVDDHLMEISHVVRGDEWLPSFPKHTLLYQAFGWTLPEFIHIPLTLNKEGGKLSKRQGDIAVGDYRAKGYLPEALINFCALLGWHPKDDNEILSLDEIIAKFEIKDIGISPAIFDIEKLDYFNGYYIRQKSKDDIARLSKPYLSDLLRGTDYKAEQAEKLIYGASVLAQERMKKLSEVAALSEFFFREPEYSAEMLVWKKSSPADTKANLLKLYDLLSKVPETEWTRDTIKDNITAHLEANRLKTGDYLWPLRVALTGREASPGPFEVAEALGKKESLARIKRAGEKL